MPREDKDGSVRISVVLHRELDAPLFDYLQSFTNSRVRSEAARRLLGRGMVGIEPQKPAKPREAAPPKPPEVSQTRPTSERQGDAGLAEFVSAIVPVRPR